MVTSHSSTKDFLEAALRYVEPSGRMFAGLRTSQTIKPTSLPMADIERAVAMGKFERLDERLNAAVRRHHVLSEGMHGVNVFAVPEMKGRRRLITEPHLNCVLNKFELPKVAHPTRLARREALRTARYMLQMDFEAFYDAIPLPQSLRDFFLFRGKDHNYYRLCTLPTGASFSVAVGQAVTWTIVDIDTPVKVFTMIDNMLVAAEAGQEEEFLLAVRRILARIGKANLLTSPDRNELEAMSDDEPLRLAQGLTTFIGEKFEWSGRERVVRNSVKTVAKLRLALPTLTPPTRRQTDDPSPGFTCRSFVALVSLVMYAHHTTQMNPANTFTLLRAYRGVCSHVARGHDWDDPLPYLHPAAHAALIDIGWKLADNEWWHIGRTWQPTYENADYDLIVVTDASRGGWGAIVADQRCHEVHTYQQRWTPDQRQEVLRARSTVMQNPFRAKHSAHAEPYAAELMLRQLDAEGRLTPRTRVAMVTDHNAIVVAQRRLNGYCR